MIPLVSVVIPTRNRPQLVCRAIQSVLNQTFNNIEILVVIDGPDERTTEALKQFCDDRLRQIVLPGNLGAAGARNAGVKQSTGDWIAFLDDDDEWLPQKLERQLQVAINSSYTYPVISSYYIAVTLTGKFIRPVRSPDETEPVGDYLFVRHWRSPFKGEGSITTPTLLIKKDLLIQFPLNQYLPVHEDWDWLIRVGALKNVDIKFIQEPLTVCYLEDSRDRLSDSRDWHYSLDWARSIRNFLTRQAYSSFLLTVVASQASSQEQWSAFLPLLKEAIHHGNLRLLDYLLYLTMWLVPMDVRQRIRALFSQKKGFGTV